MSDVDLLIVSDELTLEHIYAAIAPAERRLARRINPTLYTTEEFLRRRVGLTQLDNLVRLRQ